jgi:hypothetical protein
MQGNARLLAIGLIAGLVFVYAWSRARDQQAARIPNPTSVSSAAPTEPKGLEPFNDKPPTPPPNEVFIRHFRKGEEMLRVFNGNDFRGNGMLASREAKLFATMGATLVEAERRDIPELKEAATDFRKRLVVLQSREFPLMRQAWAKEVGKMLWENNVEIQVQAPAYSTLELIGVAFANNKTIKDTQSNLEQSLRDLRFRRARYRWASGADSTWYDFEPRADADIITELVGR